MNTKLRTDHIDQFVKDTGLKFESDGEIGFGRKCVGIINEKTESYLSYQTYDSETYATSLFHDVAMNSTPENAYHKGPYLAVLFDGTEEGRVNAINQLNDWVEKIIAAAYELTEFAEKNTFAALMNGGPVTQLCLTGGVSMGKFLEIF